MGVFGTIIAVFHSVGKKPVESIYVNNAARKGAHQSIFSLKSSGGKPSDPGALPIFSRAIWDTISSWQTGDQTGRTSNSPAETGIGRKSL